MKVNEKTLPGITMAFLALFLIVVLLLSSAITGGTDSLTHYLFARYSYAHPENFLSHWGKPLFTIMSSPFAQFGYTGAMVFNLLCGSLTAWLVYKISRKLLYDYSWVVILMVIFTPVYIVTMFTSLTEILFSLVLVFSIYLFVNERYILSALVISFIPFARTEGLMFLALFLVALLWMRQYKAIPFLLSGFILFSLAGLPVHNDLWWFFNKMPYGQQGSELYGSGPFFYYFGRMDRIMGFPLILLALIGTLTMAKWLISERKLLRDVGWTTEYVLILPSFYGYILLQSFLWWQGMMGVLASDRFLASVLPLGAFIALAGFNVIINNLSFNRVTRNRIGALIMVSILVMSFVYNKNLFILKKPNTALDQAARWIIGSPYAGREIFTYDPSLAFYLQKDPFEKSNLHQYALDPQHPEKDLGINDILFWESHFAGSEGGLDFMDLYFNPQFKLLNIFFSGKYYTTITDNIYFTAVFERVDRNEQNSDFSIIQKMDFESPLPEDREKFRTSTEAFRSDHSYHFREQGFSNALSLPVGEMKWMGKGLIRATCQVKTSEGYPQGHLLLVMEVRNNKDRLLRYLTAKNKLGQDVDNTWQELRIWTPVDPVLLEGGRIAAYVWSRSDKQAFLDDLQIEYLSLEQEGGQ